MTPARLRVALNTIGWAKRQLARRVDVDEHEVRRWESGEHEVPAPIAEWLELLTEFHIDDSRIFPLDTFRIMRNTLCIPRE